MRKNRTHRIFWITGFIALLGASLFFLGKGQMKTQDLRPVRNITAILTGKLTLPLAPENISTIPLFQIHLNLWDTILSEHGEPALAGLVDRADQGKRLVFEILPSSYFSNGRKVTSEDIAFSLSRLMGRQPGGHFNAKSLIEKVVFINNSRFEIRLRESSPAFLFLLTSPEMGIVPKESCDSEGNLRSLEITSGPFTVEGTPTADKIILKKNTYFNRAETNSPERVTVLLRRGEADLSKAMDVDHPDFQESYESAGMLAFQKLRERSDIGYKLTRPSYSIFAVTNPAQLSRDQRLSVSSLISKKLLTQYHLIAGVEQRSFETLPPETFGSLNLSAPLISQEVPTSGLPKKIRITSIDNSAVIVQAVASVLKEAGVQIEFIGMDAPDYDLFITGQGMNTDFPEIEFYLNMVSAWAFIFADDADKQVVMNTIHSANREVRSNNIQSLGKKILLDGRVIPLLVRSYVHIFKNDRIAIHEDSNYDGNVAFWRMQVKQ